MSNIKAVIDEWREFLKRQQIEGRCYGNKNSLCRSDCYCTTCVLYRQAIQFYDLCKKHGYKGE